MAQGAVSLALLVPLALLLKEPPRPAQPTLAQAEALPPISPNLVMIWLSAAVILCCVCMSVPLVHLVPLIQGHCISAQDASSVLFVMLMAAILGRVAFGKLADIIGPVAAYLIASLWQTVALFAFTQIADLASFFAFAPLYGFGYAGVMTGLLLTARALTPAARRAESMGVILAFAWLGHGLGGFQGGFLFDMTGSYTAGFATAALAGAANVVLLSALLLMIRRRTPAPLLA